MQFVDRGPLWQIGQVDSGVDEAARQRIKQGSMDSKPECEGCALSSRCHTSCGCLNIQATGSINRISPVMCHHEQVLIPLADRGAEELFAERNPLFLHKHQDPNWPLLSALRDLGGG